MLWCVWQGASSVGDPTSVRVLGKGEEGANATVSNRRLWQLRYTTV
jgi:hypothetical protein